MDVFRGLGRVPSWSNTIMPFVASFGTIQMDKTSLAECLMLVIYTHLAHAWVGAPEQSLEVATREKNGSFVRLSEVSALAGTSAAQRARASVPSFSMTPQGDLTLQMRMGTSKMLIRATKPCVRMMRHGHGLEMFASNSTAMQKRIHSIKVCPCCRTARMAASSALLVMLWFMSICIYCDGDSNRAIAVFRLDARCS
eukprot:1154199-Pelagomonas_calceolata.AAC.2